MRLFLLLTLSLLFFKLGEAKVLIITHAYNQPAFIDYHCRTFQKFLEDDYEYVVFNDARPGPNYDQIHAVCAKWNVRCIDVPQELHDHPHPDPFSNPIWTGTLRHVDGIVYAMELMGYQHDGTLVLIDSDLFLIRPLSIEKLMKDHEIVSVMRYAWNDNKALYHPWPGLACFAMNRLPNKESLDLRNGIINGNIVDTGGLSYHYLQNNNIRVKSLGLHSDNLIIWGNQNASRSEKMRDFAIAGFSRAEMLWLLKYPNPDIELFHRGHFIHMKAGRVHDGGAKIAALTELLETVLAE